MPSKCAVFMGSLLALGVVAAGPASALAAIDIDITKAVGTGEFTGALGLRQTTDAVPVDFLNLSVLESSGRRAHREDHFLIRVDVAAATATKIRIKARNNDGDGATSLLIENLTNGSLVAFRVQPDHTAAADNAVIGGCPAEGCADANGTVVAGAKALLPGVNIVPKTHADGLDAPDAGATAFTYQDHPDHPLGDGTFEARLDLDAGENILRLSTVGKLQLAELPDHRGAAPVVSRAIDGGDTHTITEPCDDDVQISEIKLTDATGTTLALGSDALASQGAINCGGDSEVAATANGTAYTFQTDRPFHPDLGIGGHTDGAHLANTGGAITLEGGQDAAIEGVYQSAREGHSNAVNYQFRVTNGRYEVGLHFAEVIEAAHLVRPSISGTRGNRVEDVTIEGAAALTLYRPAEGDSQGGPAATNTGDERIFQVDVTDELLEIGVGDLGRGNLPGAASINGIHFKRLGAVTGGGLTGATETGDAFDDELPAIPPEYHDLSAAGVTAVFVFGEDEDSGADIYESDAFDDHFIDLYLEDQVDLLTGLCGREDRCAFPRPGAPSKERDARQVLEEAGLVFVSSEIEPQDDFGLPADGGIAEHDLWLEDATTGFMSGEKKMMVAQRVAGPIEQARDGNERCIQIRDASHPITDGLQAGGFYMVVDDSITGQAISRTNSDTVFAPGVSILATSEPSREPSLIAMGEGAERLDGQPAKHRYVETFSHRGFQTVNSLGLTLVNRSAAWAAGLPLPPIDPAMEQAFRCPDIPHEGMALKDRFDFSDVPIGFCADEAKYNEPEQGDEYLIWKRLIDQGATPTLHGATPVPTDTLTEWRCNRNGRGFEPGAELNELLNNYNALLVVDSAIPASGEGVQRAVMRDPLLADGIGILTTDDEFAELVGLADPGTGSQTELGPDLVVVNNTHPITKGLPLGSVAVLTQALPFGGMTAFAAGSAPPGAVVLLETAGGGPALIAIDAGQLRHGVADIDGSTTDVATAGRMAVLFASTGFSNSTPSFLTSEGAVIVNRAIAWVSGDLDDELANTQIFTPVPTVSEWGLITFSVMMLASAVVVIRRRSVALT